MLIGKNIKIHVVDKDKYGRSVANVYANGECVNKTMVRSGYAWAYLKYLDGDLKKEMLRYENSARKSYRGLWWDKHIIAPWEWRKKNISHG